MRTFIVLLLVLGLSACFTSARRLERVHVGMSKTEVVSALGRPTSMGGDKQGEILYYRLMEGGQVMSGELNTFFIRLVDGKVDSFGRIIEPQVVGSPTMLPQPIPPPPPVPQ